jgi:hypothetical protein
LPSQIKIPDPIPDDPVDALFPHNRLEDMQPRIAARFYGDLPGLAASESS